MWVFSQNTIAGDLGVTPIIQCLASMLITSTLVHTDLHHHAIQPLPFCYPHVDGLPDPRTLFSKAERKQPQSKSSEVVDGDPGGSTRSDVEKAGSAEDVWERKDMAYYYWMLVRFIFEGTEKNMLLARPGVGPWFGRVLWTAAQGAAIGIVFGFPLWCLAIVILGPIYGTRNMGSTWAPQVIKLVYGAIVGWVTNPVIAALALGSQAERHLIVLERDLEEGSEGQQEELDDRDHVPTIHEEEDVLPNALTPPRTSGPTSPSVRGSLHAPATQTVGRSRANSAASRSPAASLRGRPPLTANVSCLVPLPLGTPVSPTATSRNRAGSTDVGPSHINTQRRPRGATISSVADSTRSFYALGGTGGRAQRSRSNTVNSAAPVPGLVISSAEGTSPAKEPPTTAPLPSSGSLGSAGLGMSGLFTPRTAPTSPPAAWDVFGRRDSAPAMGSGGGRERAGSGPGSITGRMPRRRDEGRALDPDMRGS
jgi:hypothetical protein